MYFVVAAQFIVYFYSTFLKAVTLQLVSHRLDLHDLRHCYNERDARRDQL